MNWIIGKYITLCLAVLMLVAVQAQTVDDFYEIGEKEQVVLPILVNDQIPEGDYFVRLASNAGADLSHIQYDATTQAITYNRKAELETSDGYQDVFSYEMVENDSVISSSQIVVLTEFDTLCGDVDCVWPGDSNNDGTADVIDLLMLGRVYNSVGPARSIQCIDWAPQIGSDWDMSMDGLNYKHSDCNGDGAIDGTDMQAISANIDDDITFTSTLSSGASVVLDLEVLNETEVGPGDSLFVKISVGTEGDPIENLYGLAVQFSYESSLVKEGSAFMSFGECFICSESMCLSMDVDQIDKISAAITRTDGFGRSGYGTIGILGIVMEDVLIAKSGHFNMPIEIASAQLRTAKGDEIGAMSQGVEAVILLSETAGVDEVLDRELSVYPNPAKDFVLLQWLESELKSISVFDLTGRLLISQVPNASDRAIQLDTSSFPSGIYSLIVDTEQGQAIRKLLIK